MAEPSAATQSPSVSSSSSGAEPSATGGGGSSGACPALGAKSCGSSCADSFVSSSSSQPVSLFSTSQASSPGHTAFLSKEAGQMEQQVNKNQESKKPDETTLNAENKSTLQTAQKPPTKLSKAEGGICPYSLSPSEVPGGSIIEKDSPESPFEVIIDKAAFDKEFKDAYKESANDFGRWATHTDKESSADMLEAHDKVFPLRSKEVGHYPTSALLNRQFSHTTAALEEVSRCVNDMHNFTNEILTWDLVPQVKQPSDKSDYITKTAGLDRSSYDSEIPVVNLKTHQKIPVCSVNGSTPIAKSTGGRTDTSPAQENAVKKAGADHLSCTKEVISRGGQDKPQQQGGPLAGLPRAPFEKCMSVDSGVAAVKVALPDDHPKELRWQNSMLGGVTEADSSGESDDTVVEDITADTKCEDNKIQTGKPVSVAGAAVKTDEREIKENLSCNKENNSVENFEGSVSDSEVQSDILERSPAGQSAPSGVPDRKVTSEDAKQSGGMSEAAPANPLTADSPKLPAVASPKAVSETKFSLDATTSAYLESLHETSVKDIDDSSPEDLIAAFPEAGNKVAVDKGEGNTFEATAGKTMNFKSVLPVKASRESELGNSEVTAAVKSKSADQGKERSGRELLDAFPTQGAPVASLDLEQEQLTIRALKELSERQAEKSASAQDERESPEETLKQTFISAPASPWPQRSNDGLAHAGVKTESDVGISNKPTMVRETTEVDVISSLSKTELVDKHVLARLLTDISVHDLIFWRDVKKTGFVFGTTLVMLLSLAAFSVISVVSYLILALLSVTISFRVYKSVIQAVQKSEEGHPFKAYLDTDITLSSEAFHNYVNAAMVHVNKALKLIIRLFLVEDLVDSLKLAVFMWLMTYVGAVFNGITLLILAELLVFSVPIVYEKYKTQIDHYVGIARDQTKSIVEKLQAKLPGLAKKKAE